MPSRLYYSERKLWNEHPESRAVLERLSRLRQRNEVPWALVERMLEVGNRLAEALEYEANPACDEWDEARYAVAPYSPQTEGRNKR